MRRPPSPGAAIAFLFLIIGLPFLGKTGLHYDATFELACFYPCSDPVFRPTLFGHVVPVMIIQYLGTLKAWLYLPLLNFHILTPYLLRLPSLAIGAASVWMFYAILDHVSGRPAAVVGAMLLATDASFLIATSYDFGPIALLHFLILSAVLLLLRFDVTLNPVYLAIAFVLFGASLWYKALAVWMLGGLAAGAVVVFPKRLFALLTPGRVAIVTSAIALGAFPLIYYNVVSGGATLHPANIATGATPLSQKVLVLKRTLNGSVFFGWLTDEGSPGTELEPASLGDRVSIGITRTIGHIRSNWMLYAVAGSCCLLPSLWFTPSRKPTLFALIYLLAARGLMVLLPGTGAALHHVILLWPFPHFLVAVAGVQLARSLGKYGARLLTTMLIFSVGYNLLLINAYYADLVTRGTTVVWTDAIHPLFENLRSATEIVTVDWGYATTLCLLSHGQMPMKDISFLLLNPTEAQKAYVGSLMGKSQTVFVDHVGGDEQLPAAHARIAQIAAAARCACPARGALPAPSRSHCSCG
jgi:hypothetical protein